MNEAIDIEALRERLETHKDSFAPGASREITFLAQKHAFETVLGWLDNDELKIPNAATVRWSPECWAQYPEWFKGETLPDEYIFNPAWNRERVNAWWLSREAKRDERS